jgi:PKD repeat protein
MNKRTVSTNLFRTLVIIALVIPLTLGATSPAKAAFDGTEIITWGYNGGGQYTTPSGLADVIAIDAGGSHNLALRSDGTVVAWGENFSGQRDVPADLSGVVAIAAGQAHSLALKSDGTLVAWGDNSQGQTDVPSGLTDVVAIGAGQFHSLARKRDGTFVGWGNNGFGQLTFPADLAEVVAFDVGYNHNLAIKTDGTVIAWGYNIFGETNVPAGLTDVVAVAAGRNHSLALKSDGTVVGWGNSYYGQSDVPADLTGVVAIAAGGYHSLALKNDGTVVGWGRNDYSQSSPPSTVSGAVAIDAGSWHSLAIVPADAPLNTAPVANPGGSYLGAINTSISFDGSLSSDPENDPLTYAWTFGDGGTGTGVTPTHAYTAAGIYDVCLTVNDGSLYSEPACTLAVVYDPSAGFVTGGGWINSPIRAYEADETLTGKATFGFVSRYQKGTSAPTGNTAFEFDLAGLAFSSQSYDWLVVNKVGTNAQFKGSGLINGAADPNGNAYKFMLWAGDGSIINSADTFRIRLWWEDAAGEHDVYDNGVDQPVAGGSIVVHTKK